MATNAVSIARLIKLARDLKSEDGENPEYDRALVELITDAAGMTMEYGRPTIAEQIGIDATPFTPRRAKR
jgi:hypothetical protein